MLSPKKKLNVDSNIVGLYLNHCCSSFQSHLNCSKKNNKTCHWKLRGHSLRATGNNAFALALFRTISIRCLRTIVLYKASIL